MCPTLSPSIELRMLFDIYNDAPVDSQVTWIFTVSYFGFASLWGLASLREMFFFVLSH